MYFPWLFIEIYQDSRKENIALNMYYLTIKNNASKFM